MKEYIFDDYVIYQDVFEYVDSNMYLIVKNNQGLIIDPHKNDRVFNLLKKNNVNDILVLLTHEHPDHISGLKWLNDNFNTTIICQKYCANSILDERATRPVLISFILEEQDRLNGTNLLEKFNKDYVPYTCKTDIAFESYFEYTWCKYKLRFQRLLGHSKGSCCVIINDEIIFTGDTLLKDYPVITRFPGGCKKEYINSTIPFFEQLGKNLTVLPGHGNKFLLNDIFNKGKLNVEFR